MSAVLQENSNLPQIESRFDYEPEVRDIHFATTTEFVPFENKIMLVKPDETPIGVVGLSHHTENFKVFYDKVCNSLQESELDTTGAKVTFTGGNNNAVMQVSIILPNHNFNKILNERAFTKITLLDSHDASMTRSIQTEIVRMWCLNGCVAPNQAETIFRSQRHTINADSTTLADHIYTHLEFAETHAINMAQYKKIPMFKDEAFQIFKGNLLSAKSVDDNKGRKLEKIDALYNKYEHDGPTVYRAYNVLTDYATHVDTTRKHANPVARIERARNEVVKVLNSNAWKEATTV